MVVKIFLMLHESWQRGASWIDSIVFELIMKVMQNEVMTLLQVKEAQRTKYAIKDKNEGD